MAATNHVGVFAPVLLAGATPSLAQSGYVEQFAHIAIQDRAEIPTGVEAGSRIYIGDISWDLIPNRDLSVLYFDDAGTGVTINLGDANDPDALIAGHDISAAAGSTSMLKSVDIDKHGDPLWKLLGYASRDAAGKLGPKARLFITTVGANITAATTFAWTLAGTNA
jgi:hypothetical protein